MNNEQSAIDVQSSAVMVRESHQPLTKFDAHARKDALETILNRQALVMEVMKSVMKDGVHFGKIPGCGDKPALFKAGAEKLAMVFRLTPTFTIKQIDHEKGNREYEVICTLSDGSQGVGVCSTLESKYRFRGSAKKLTDKTVPGGYWDLRKADPAKAQAMLGGKGFGTAKNDVGVWMITEPTEDKVENDNPADVYNTVLKMAKKRAQVDATLTATGTSDLLTQDIEEMVEAANAASAENSGAAPAADQKEEKKEPKKAAEPKKRATSKAPDVQSELPKEEFEKLWAFMEAGKAKFLLMANDDINAPFAWTWAVRNGHILETEKLDAIRPTKLFPSCNLNVMIAANQPFMKADYIKAVDEITEIGKAGPLPEIDRIAYEKAYGLFKKPAKAKEPAAAEVPRDAEAAWKSLLIPGWSKHVKELGFKTFGDLPKKYLWWWCCKWEPQGYEGKPPKQEDIELRKTMDFVKDNYDFESKEDEGSAPGSAEPERVPVPPEDDVPF